jgi:hypothetical protein
MKQLQEHGPAGAIFRRFGRPHNQTLLAIGNPRREAHDARQQAEYEAREREYKEQLRRAAEQKRAEREARRPVCASCGTRFTDGRCYRARQVGRPTRDPPAPVRGLQAASDHRRTPSSTARVRGAPGARPGRARAEGRRHLALLLPQLTQPDPAEPAGIALPGYAKFSYAGWPEPGSVHGHAQ